MTDEQAQGAAVLDPTEEPGYGTRRVAQILGVDEPEADRLMRSGEIPGAYAVPGAGDYRRVRRIDLIEWMANKPQHHAALERLCGPLPIGWPAPAGWTGGPAAVSVADLRVACLIAGGACYRRELVEAWPGAVAALKRLIRAKLARSTQSHLQGGDIQYVLTPAGFRATAAMRANPREERDAAGEAEAN